MIGTKYIKQMLRITFLCMLISVSGDVTATPINWFSRGISHTSTTISHALDRISTRCAAIGSKLTKRDLGIATATLSVLGLSLGILGYKKYQAQQRQAEQELQARNLAQKQKMLTLSSDQITQRKNQLQQLVDSEQRKKDAAETARINNEQLTELHQQKIHLEAQIKTFLEDNRKTEAIIEQLKFEITDLTNQKARLEKQIRTTTETDRQSLARLLGSSDTTNIEELKQKAQTHISAMTSQLQSLQTGLQTATEELSRTRTDLIRTTQELEEVSGWVSPALKILKRSTESKTNIFKDTPWHELLYTKDTASILYGPQQQTIRIQSYTAPTTFTTTEESITRLGQLNITASRYDYTRQNGQNAKKVITAHWVFIPTPDTGQIESKGENQPIDIFNIHGTNSDSDGYGFDFNHLSTHAAITYAQQLALATGKTVNLYSFEWSGALDTFSADDRLETGLELAKIMKQKIETDKPYMTIAKAHSHGCNVLNNALQALKIKAELENLTLAQFKNPIDVPKDQIPYIDNVIYIAPPQFADKKLDQNGMMYNARNVYVVFGGADYTGRLGSWYSSDWFNGSWSLHKPHSYHDEEIVRTVMLNYDGISLDHINVVPVALRFLGGIIKFLHNDLPVAFESIINIVPKKLYPTERFAYNSNSAVETEPESVWALEGVADYLQTHLHSAAPEPTTATKTIVDLLTSAHKAPAQLLLSDQLRSYFVVLAGISEQTKINYKKRYAKRNPASCISFKHGGSKVNELVYTARMNFSLETLRNGTANPLLQEIFNCRIFSRPTNGKAGLDWFPTTFEFTPVKLADGTCVNLAGIAVGQDCLPLPESQATSNGGADGQAPTANPAAGGPEPVAAPAT